MTNEQRVLLDVPNELATQRLLLRVPRPGDSARLWPAVVESQAELALWMPWAYPKAEETKTEEFCRRAAASFITREQFHFHLNLKGTDALIGTCGIHRANWNVPMVEIGYWLRTPHCGKGYMTEAVQAMTSFAFEKLSAQRVEIRCDQRNRPSAAVAERAGFQLEGVLRHDERNPRGELRNTCIYAKIAAMT